MTTPFKIGVHRHVAPKLYHSWEAASNGALSQFLRSPAHMRAYLDREMRETPVLALGRAIHAAVLEPERFAQDYGLLPERMDRRTKEGKAQWGALIEQFGQGNVLSPEDHATCMAIRNAVHQHQTAAALISGTGDVELSVVWDDPYTGVRCKARWDRYSPEIPGGAIVDLKTTKDASRGAFERAIFTYGYHRQASLYLMGARVLDLPVRHYCIIAAEKEPPYAVAVYRITEGTIDATDEQVRELLRRYRQCQESGKYPGYPDEVQDITVPDWAWRLISGPLDELGEETA